MKVDECSFCRTECVVSERVWYNAESFCSEECKKENKIKRPYVIELRHDEEAPDVKQFDKWCIGNCKGSWKREGPYEYKLEFEFQIKDEAALFKLMFG